MVQPYNYTIQAPSAFEQLVSGLKLGASMQEMQAAAQQRQMEMEQLRAQQEQQARQRQLMDDVIGGRANRGTWLEIGMMGSSEAQRKGAWDQVANMDQQAVRSQIGFGSQLAFALKKNPAVAKQMLEDALRANPNDEFLKRINQLSETDTDFAAQTALLALPGLGKDGLDAYKETVNRLFPEKAEVPEAFKTLDANAVEKQFGMQNVPPGLYRLNTQTQKLESIGGGGTTVNIKNEGPIAQDYRRVRDAQGNILYDEPIPGTKAAREAEQAVKAAESRASGQVRTASTVTQSIDSLLSDLKKEKEAKGTEKISPYTRITGVAGKAFEGYPGGARQTAKGYIDTIRANIGFDRLDQMRQESPTGGALGQIAVQEIQFLQASLGSLDLDADPDVLIKNLERIKTAYDNVMRKAAAYPNAAKYGFGTGAEPVAGGAAAAPAAAPTPRPAPAPATGGRDIGGGFRVLD
jgi:hypothetical protein